MDYNPKAFTSLLNNLGSFWSDIFTGTEPVSRAIIAQHEQNVFDALAAMNAVSLHKIDLFKRELWKKYEVSRKDIFDASNVPYEFGGLLEFDGSKVFNQIRDNQGLWRIPKPRDLVASRFITNRPVMFDVVWTEGIDFRIDGDFIICRRDPYELFDSFVDLSTSEEFVNLWFAGADFEDYRIYNHFGFVVELFSGLSSEAYLELVKAAYSTLQVGSRSLVFRLATAAALGIPAIRNTSETVEAVVTGYGEKQVITDRGVYNYPESCTIAVDVGDTLAAGDIPIEDVQILEGADIVDANVLGLVFDRSNCRIPFDIGVSVPNELVSTTYSVDSGGIVRVRFPVFGTLTDVEAFWAYVESDNVNTIARSLRSGSGTGEPLQFEIPAQINPVQYLLANLYRPNTVVASIDIGVLQNSVVPTSFLRRYLPAHVALLSHSNLTVDGDSLLLDNDLTGSPVEFNSGSEDVYSTAAIEENFVTQFQVL